MWWRKRETALRPLGEFGSMTTDTVAFYGAEKQKGRDHLLFVDDKAIAVVEAKREENPLAEDVQSQAEGYATHPQSWYGLLYDGLIPLVYLANGSKIYFRNLLSPDVDYVELAEMHSPKRMPLLHLRQMAGSAGLFLRRAYSGPYRHAHAGSLCVFQQ